MATEDGRSLDNTERPSIYISKHQPQKSGKTGKLFKLHIGNLDSIEEREYKYIDMINLITV